MPRRYINIVLLQLACQAPTIAEAVRLKWDYASCRMTVGPCNLTILCLQLSIQVVEFLWHTQTAVQVFALAWLFVGGDTVLRRCFRYQRLPPWYFVVQRNIITFSIFIFLIMPRLLFLVPIDPHPPPTARDNDADQRQGVPALPAE